MPGETPQTARDKFVVVLICVFLASPGRFLCVGYGFPDEGTCKEPNREIVTDIKRRMDEWRSYVAEIDRQSDYKYPSS